MVLFRQVLFTVILIYLLEVPDFPKKHIFVSSSQQVIIVCMFCFIVCICIFLCWI